MASSPLKRLLRWAKTTRDGGDDDQLFPTQQVTYLFKTSKATMWFPFGYHANVTAGQLAMLFSMQGNTEAAVALPGSPRERPALEPGEVAVFLPSGTGGAMMTLKADGTIVVKSTVGITLDADVTVTGNMTVQGDTALAAVVTSNGVDISDTHTHAGSATAPTGAVSPTGVPV